MVGKPVPLCGFAQVIMYYDVESFEQYTRVMLRHPSMCAGMSKELWRKYKRQQRRLLNNSNFYRGQAEKDEFLQYFSISKWGELDDVEKDRHTVRRCPACRDNKHRYTYRHLRKNSLCIQDDSYTSSLDYMISKLSSTKEECAKMLLKEIDEKFSHKFGGSFSETVFQNNKEENVKSTIAAIGENITERHSSAILAHNISYRKMANFRKDITLTSSPTTPRKTIDMIKHDNYKFNRDTIKEYLAANSHRKTVWTDLASRYPVTSRSGRVISKTQASQIIKSFAVSQNLAEKSTTHRQRRRVHRKEQISGVSVSLAKLYPTDAKLKEIVNQKMGTGEIEAGIPIVPVTHIYRSIGVDGNTKTREITMYGRKVPLQTIMDMTLKAHNEAGMLRPPFVNCTVEQALEDLKRKGVSTSAATIDDLNRLRSRRMFAVWHDHSTIAGHTHLLVLVSLIYDPLVYLTAGEYKKSSIESAIERPHLHIFARSGSSVSDHALYTHVRAEELVNLKPSATSSGELYVSVNRIGAGDSPARSFESGNQINGHFPCHCGADARKFCTPRNFDQPKYLGLYDRMEKINKSDRWQRRSSGTLAVYDNLDVHTLRSELQDRSIGVEGLDKAEMKRKLDLELSGICRPPALLCSELQVDLSSYEIAHFEPLHDIKSIIGNIFKEMFYVVPNQLKETLKTALSQMQGHHHEISGSNARLTLLKLRNYLQTMSNHDISDQNTIRLQRLLTNLSYIQHLAYSHEHKRSTRNILALYNLTYIFSLDYTKLFCNPKSVGIRAMFGMPYHSITAHFPEWYRLVALRSLNAESQERCFKDIKMTTLTTNHHHDHIILNSVVRLSEKMKTTMNGNALIRQESQISQVWKRIPPRQNTVITKEMVNENAPAFTVHKKRISDYLLDGCWHIEEDGSWIFYDGPDSLEERDSPSKPKMRISESNISDVWSHTHRNYELYKASSFHFNSYMSEKASGELEEEGEADLVRDQLTDNQCPLKTTTGREDEYDMDTDTDTDAEISDDESSETTTDEVCGNVYQP